MRDKLIKQGKRFFIDAIGLVQRSILGDDIISVTLRKYLIQLMGVKWGQGTKMLAQCDVLGGRISFGKGCFINRRCYFDSTGRITIGNHVSIAHGVTFVTAHHDIGTPQKRAGEIDGRTTVIGDGVWIGANATILPGVTIGESAVVAACAVVTKDVPPNTLVKGVPAIVAKQLSES